jgi:energy-coupling factor transport system permease protein
MIPKIPIGRYIKTDSFLHTLAPHIKILSLFALIIGVLFLKTAEEYVIFSAYLLILIFLSKIRISFYIKALKPVLFLIVFTFILNILFTDGKTVLYKLWFITIYKEGLLSALQLMFRLIFIIVISSVLTLTTSPIEITDGLEILLKPFKLFKFPVHEFSLMLTISLRFIPTLFDEIDKIIKAQMARGVDFENKSFIEKLKAFIPIFIPLFFNSFRRAEELAQAMEVRCYRGGEGRTKYRHHPLHFIDYFFALLTFTFLTLVILI